jgi:hypothetical protein
MDGFWLAVKDNDSYAFRDRPAIRDDTAWYALHQSIVPNMTGTQRSGVRRCSACNELLNKWNEPLTGLIIKKRQFDISCTYDGIEVASAAFKEVYDSHGLSDLSFSPLPDDPSFYCIRATKVVEFDPVRRGTRFEEQCPSCGRYRSIVGATPVYLKPGSEIPDMGFARTDLEFASGDEKSPVLLCGPAAGKVLKSAKLSGLDLVKL